MLSHLQLLFLSGLLFWSPVSLADDDIEEDEEDFGDMFEDDEKQDDDENIEGSDSAEIYRDATKEYKSLPPEDEIIAWRKYLQKYPNSKFTPAIDKRIEAVENQLYSGDIDDAEELQEGGRKELRFAQPLLLENIDPLTKLRFAFEMGLPNYINFLVDYERQLSRELSVHGGFRNRYTGSNAEFGVRYALMKSTRLQTIVTAIGDIRINTDPFFPAFRPQIAAGKRFTLPNGFRIDSMAQLGTDLQIFNGITPALIGGIHITFVPSDTVNIFFESSTYMKEFFWEEGNTFSFNTVSFGLKFVNPKQKDKFIAGFGTTVPYAHNYWRYHYGSIAGDVNLFFK